MAILAVIVAACTPSPGTSTSPTIGTSTTSPTPSSTLPPVVECPGEGEFQEGGGIADIDGEGSDSSTIGRISWQTSDLCETFTLQFETSQGAPATAVPDIRVDHLESFQVIRVSVDVESAVITDQLVETNLVERLYAVRSLDGGMFVDLHLAEPAAVRVATTASPARLSLDLRPGFVPFAGQSNTGEHVVLVAPTAEATVEAATQLTGYARDVESNVLVVVTQGGEMVTRANATTADSLDTWGEFRVEVGLPPGRVSVFVGEESPEDGSLDGLTVDLTVS